MEFLKRWLGIKNNSKEQAELIENKFKELQDKVFVELAGLKNENSALKGELQSKNTRITELLTKLRDQNEADLLLECKRIEKKIIEGEKRVDINLAQYNAMQNMGMSYSQQLAAQQNNGLLGLLGGTWR